MYVLTKQVGLALFTSKIKFYMKKIDPTMEATKVFFWFVTV